MTSGLLFEIKREANLEPVAELGDAGMSFTAEVRLILFDARSETCIRNEYSPRGVVGTVKVISAPWVMVVPPGSCKVVAGVKVRPWSIVTTCMNPAQKG